LIENITPDFRYKVAPNVAVFAEIPVTENFSFQPEIAYNQKGFRVEEGIDIAGQFGGVNIPINGRVNVKTHYLEVPILAKFHFGDKTAAHYYMMVGPAVGFLVDSGLRINVLNIFPVNTGFPTQIFKSAELSGIAAAGFELPVAEKIKVFTEARYQLGLSRILDTPVVQLPVRNRSFSGGMGLKFAMN
ncbi:MAG: PorT family protein, partial [Spirosomaceae bacterium]|nr:PorT family protein [Spirosomataceae bacterium]